MPADGQKVVEQLPISSPTRRGGGVGRRCHRNRVPPPNLRRECRSSTPTSPGPLGVREECRRGSELDLAVVGAGHRDLYIAYVEGGQARRPRRRPNSRRRWCRCCPRRRRWPRTTPNQLPKRRRSQGGGYIDTSGGPRGQPAVAPPSACGTQINDDNQASSSASALARASSTPPKPARRPGVNAPTSGVPSGAQGFEALCNSVTRGLANWTLTSVTAGGFSRFAPRPSPSSAARSTISRRRKNISRSQQQ